jgi:hypothetical protein
LWIIGEGTAEFWQTYSDTILPVRKVRSSTIERGIKAKASLAEVGDRFAFLADDLTVRLVSGNEFTEISDLEFNLKVRGNGTATSPGFSITSDAIGFFVDSPTHKFYYITFPSEGWTWGFDLANGLTHTRKSEDHGFWRANYAAKFADRIIIGDRLSSTVWTLDPNSKTEGSEILRAVVTTPSISYSNDITIPLIELDVEVGQIDDPNIDPKIMVEYTKDGGYNWKNAKDVSLGKRGNYKKRVPLRKFGRIVRYKDFALRLTVTAGVKVQYFGAEFPLGQSI